MNGDPTPPQSLCPFTGKVRHPSRKLAKQALKVHMRCADSRGQRRGKLSIYRCEHCGALWRFNPPDPLWSDDSRPDPLFPNGSWTVQTPDIMRECCDNAPMGDQIEPLPTVSVNLAAMHALWETWAKNPPQIPANGNRLFVRWVQLDAADPGWDDWTLAGLVTDGVVAWNNPEMADRPDCQQIQKRIRDGKRHGRIQSDDKLTKEEWGLFVGDGPTESRVSDWAKAD